MSSCTVLLKSISCVVSYYPMNHPHNKQIYYFIVLLYRQCLWSDLRVPLATPNWPAQHTFMPKAILTQDLNLFQTIFSIPGETINPIHIHSTLFSFPNQMLHFQLFKCSKTTGIKFPQKDPLNRGCSLLKSFPQHSTVSEVSYTVEKVFGYSCQSHLPSQLL